MVQSYLRHGPTQAFGLVCSPSSNSLYDGKLAYVPALEDVLVWDVKKGEMMGMWHEAGHRAQVTALARSPTQADVFAVGYADGSVRLWSAAAQSVSATFNGHKGAVSALAFDASGTRLASGSQDTSVIVWDVVAEAGLYRLRGHRDQITALAFVSVAPSGASSSSSTAAGFLLSSAKDTFVKLWDLAAQHCVQTLVAHRGEVWALDLNAAQDLLFTGSNEGDLKIWRIDHSVLQDGLREGADGKIAQPILPATSLPLSSRHRVAQITLHKTLPYLAIQSADRSVEIIRVRTEDEIRKKQARRRKRAKEKGKEVAEPGEDAEGEVDLADRFTPHLVVRASGKVRSFCFPDNAAEMKGGAPIFLALANNAMEVCLVPPPSKGKDKAALEPTKLYALDLPGHRADVRALCLNGDDSLLASASNGQLKIWNMRTFACIRTLECGAAICSAFLPGDRHIAVGTKSGELLLYDLAASALVETIAAHSGTLWSLHVVHDGQALVTGSADKDVKFWAFKWAKPADGEGAQTLALQHTRTLKMSDEVLSVRGSPDGRLLCVALLDATVKVFYADSLKFFLSLYGHKLPVLAMDISHDSKLIVTASADKNVKIWGLDFGDCHRSIFAHDDSVMQVAFEARSHNFWSAGKDAALKYWDGDKFENIQKLEGHAGEIWALAAARSGNFVVTGAHDKSIRVWEKLDEPLFLEEERERALETLYEGGLADALNADGAAIGSGAPDAEPGASSNETEAEGVSKQTGETLMAGERIAEALELADGERAVWAEFEDAKKGMPQEQAARLPPPPRHPVLAAHDLEPAAWVLRTVEGIPGAALQDALLVLPFGKVVSLMGYLSIWAQKEWNITLVSQIMFFLLKTHHHQVVAHRAMRTTLIPLRAHLRAALARQKAALSYNLAALQYIRRQAEGARTARFYEEEGGDEERVQARIAEGAKKRKRVHV